MKLATLGLLAILGHVSSHPTTTSSAPITNRDFMAGVDTSSWITVDFQGTNVTYNPSIFKSHSQGGMSRLPAVDGGLRPQFWCQSDCCGASSFGGTDAPWASEGDCAAIRDWAYAQNQAFNIWTNTPDYHGVVFAGSCAFGAGTRNIFDTSVGSSDIGDLTRDGINGFAVSLTP